MDGDVRRLFEAVEARQAAAAETEEWMVLLTTDHGGSARSSMARPVATAFDGLEDAAFGQLACEGVHGLLEAAGHAEWAAAVQRFCRVCPELTDRDKKRKRECTNQC